MIWHSSTLDTTNPNLQQHHVVIYFHTITSFIRFKQNIHIEAVMQTLRGLSWLLSELWGSFCGVKEKQTGHRILGFFSMNLKAKLSLNYGRSS